MVWHCHVDIQVSISPLNVLNTDGNFCCCCCCCWLLFWPFYNRNKRCRYRYKPTTEVNFGKKRFFPFHLIHRYFFRNLHLPQITFTASSSWSTLLVFFLLFFLPPSSPFVLHLGSPILLLSPYTLRISRVTQASSRKAILEEEGGGEEGEWNRRSFILAGVRNMQKSD